MFFCSNCNNYMKIIEKDIDNIRNIYYICQNCDIKENVNDYMIFNKSYQNKINDDKWDINKKYSLYDKTLPRKYSKCPECKKYNENIYYQNKNLRIKIICNNCMFSWIN